MTITIGIILILSFIFMVWYCVKGYNLMVGFFIMATLWTVLALVGNAIEPNSAITALLNPAAATSKVANTTGNALIPVLNQVYQNGPAGFAQSILVNIFFGSFFGRVLMDSGIAATLIRKVVELGGDKPRITMSLLCIVTSIIFMTMTGIGPVIAIAVIVLPIFMSLGIPSPIAMFAFMGSIMAGILANITNFLQYQGIFSAFYKDVMQYSFNDYFKIAIIGTVVTLIAVLLVSNLSLGRKKSYAMAVTASADNGKDAPAYSWIAIILPVVLIMAFKGFPVILAFIVSAVYAMLTTGLLKGGFKEVCRKLAKFFSDGAIDVAPMIGFLLMLSMFNNAAAFSAPYFTAIFGNIIPTSAIILTIMFAVLVPLGFFRGPTNLVGSGTALLAVVAAANPHAGVAFMFPLFAIATIVPQHLDITQSWVAWGLGYTKVSAKEYMKLSIPTGYVVGAIMIVVLFVLYGSQF